MIKIATVVGARPQFIKAAAVSRQMKEPLTEVLIHTGQHYDTNLSEVFFDELDIPAPKYNLGIGSGMHGEQTGEMLAKIEAVLMDENPDWVLVYGDTNSTLAGALAAAKLHINVAHVEAGLRSHNRRMPEEINRVLTDHISDLLFCPSEVAVKNLAEEGITDGVVVVGDVMADSLSFAAKRAPQKSQVIKKLALESGEYYLGTVHRADNTGDRQRLTQILEAFQALDLPIVFPIHPRTKKAIGDYKLQDHLSHPNMVVIQPVGYLDMVQLEQSAKMILTDSGGIQKEAYWLKVPCITLRNETEWVETVHSGWNILVGADKGAILKTVTHYQEPDEYLTLYGDDQAGKRIVELILFKNGLIK